MQKDTNTVIHIALATDRGFVVPTVISIASFILTNQKQIFCFHILYAGLTKKDMQLIQTTIQKFCIKCSVAFYDMDEYAQKANLTKDISIKQTAHVTFASFYRLFLATVLQQDIKKVLYVDGDVICCEGIKDFYDTDLKGFSLAAVHDPTIEKESKKEGSCFLRLGIKKENGYFCAGAILINLEYWREHDIEKKAVLFVKENQDLCKFYDQDALNKVLSGSVKYVCERYDLVSSFFDRYTKDPKSLSQEFSKSIFSPVLLHYTGQRKPWHIECRHPLKKVWRVLYKATFNKSPHLKHKYKGKIRLLWNIKRIVHALGIKHYEDYTLHHEYDDLVKRLCAVFR